MKRTVKAWVTVDRDTREPHSVSMERPGRSVRPWLVSVPLVGTYDDGKPAPRRRKRARRKR